MTKQHCMPEVQYLCCPDTNYITAFMSVSVHSGLFMCSSSALLYVLLFCFSSMSLSLVWGNIESKKQFKKKKRNHWGPMRHFAAATLTAIKKNNMF